MTTTLTIINNIDSIRKELRARRKGGIRIGLVPTMGALHDGHLSLARQSVDQCDLTVVSIFVNPTQFAPNEDLDKYPRDLEQDAELLQQIGVDLIFHPDVEEMYPQGFSTSVEPPTLAGTLEGEFRASHFAGVCTVVLKLFNIVMPELAFFGQKDFQQAAIIKQMFSDLNVPVEIVVCPIVRSDDGLALSSRNRYLSASQWQTALSLNQTLQFASNEIVGGQTDGHVLMAEMRQRLIDDGVTSVDYAVICDPNTLETMNEVSRPAVALIAAYVGETRLIDNCLIE